MSDAFMEYEKTGHVEKDKAKEIKEIRVHSKFGGKDDDYTVSLLFGNNTTGFYQSKLFTYLEAMSFRLGIIEGFNLKNGGYIIDTHRPEM